MFLRIGEMTLGGANRQVGTPVGKLYFQLHCLQFLNRMAMANAYKHLSTGNYSSFMTFPFQPCRAQLTQFAGILVRLLDCFISTETYHYRKVP